MRESAFARTAPIGFTPQTDFLNGAFLVETELDRENLNALLKDVEQQLGRTRKGGKYGPRTIDLDIVVWNGTVVDPDYHSRKFLRKAVGEVVDGKKLQDKFQNDQPSEAGRTE